MTANGILQIVLYFLVLLALTKPLGAYMAKVFAGERTFLHGPLRPLEVGLYKLCGIDESGEQHWTVYAGAMLAFSLVGVLFTYGILRMQQWLPLNPQGLANVGTDLSFNTAVSFGSNTNWQSYVPEVVMSYFSQMIGLATHNFWSAASGICVAIAFTRGFARHSAQTLGSFWVDFTRCTVYILLPLSVVGALLLVSQGCIQNFHPYTKVATLEGAVQTLPQGPLASQESIKMIGTNGGGFTNANSARFPISCK
jgi:K+-transporting ATPase ATPase A chain